MTNEFSQTLTFLNYIHPRPATAEEYPQIDYDQGGSTHFS